jgi:acyl-CoA thioesterase-2
MVATVDALVGLLDVRAEAGGAFTGPISGSARPNVFGGHVLGQALASAVRTVDADRPPHSLHAYFLRAGDSTRPIRYHVTNVREGRSFSTREVRGVQGEQHIFTMSASFHRDEPGPDHQRSVPRPPPADAVPSDSSRPGEWPEIYQEWSCLDIRHVPTESRAQIWMRLDGRLPDEPALHACVLACISDLTLLAVTLVPHGIPSRHEGYRLASLDHAMWFHRPARVDDWLLYDQTTPSTSNGLGLATGRLLAADGTLVASVAQEGLLRPEW